MSKYKCYYYKTQSGKSPVEEFIDSLEYKTQVKFFYKKGLLEEFGPKLPFPHARYIGEGVFELRFEGREGRIRILYFFFYENKIIFTNGFVKKTKKIPKKEIEVAEYRKKEFLESIK
jgi:phage-related protein